MFSCSLKGFNTQIKAKESKLMFHKCFLQESTGNTVKLKGTRCFIFEESSVIRSGKGGISADFTEI